MERRQKWVENVGRENLVLNKYALLCSQHFLSEMFGSTGLAQRLKVNAVPTLFDHSNLQHEHLFNQTMLNNMSSGSSLDISLQPVVRVKRLRSSPEIIAGPKLDTNEEKAVNKLTQKKTKWTAKRRATKVGQNCSVNIERLETCVSDALRPVVERSSRAIVLCSKLNAEDLLGKRRVSAVQKRHVKIGREDICVSDALHPVVGRSSRAVVLSSKLEDENGKKNHVSIKQKHHGKIGRDEICVSEALHPVVGRSSRAVVLCSKLEDEDGKENHVFIRPKRPVKFQIEKIHVTDALRPVLERSSRAIVLCSKLKDEDGKRNHVSTVKTKSASKVEISRQRKTKQSLRSHKKTSAKKLAPTSKKLASKESDVKTECIEHKDIMSCKTKATRKKRKTKESVRSHKKSSPEKLSSKEPISKEPPSKEPPSKKPPSKKPVSKEPASKKPASKKPASKKPASKGPAVKIACIEENGMLFMRCIIDTDSSPEISRKRKTKESIRSHKKPLPEKLASEELASEEPALNTTCVEDNGVLYMTCEEGEHTALWDDKGESEMGGVSEIKEEVENPDVLDLNSLQHQTTHPADLLEQDSLLQNSLDRSADRSELTQTYPALCLALSKPHNTYLWEMFSRSPKSVDHDKQIASCGETFKHCRTCSCAKENIPLTPGFHPAIPIPTDESKNCFRCFTQEQTQRNCATMCQICDKYFCFTPERNCLVLYHYGAL